MIALLNLGKQIEIWINTRGEDNTESYFCSAEDYKQFIDMLKEFVTDESEIAVIEKFSA